MAEPDDMILPLPLEMRAENRAEHAGTRGAVGTLEKRLERMEGQFESFPHALTGDTLMSKLITGESEERIEALEKKVRELEGHQ